MQAMASPSSLGEAIRASLGRIDSHITELNNQLVQRTGATEWSDLSDDEEDPFAVNITPPRRAPRINRYYRQDVPPLIPMAEYVSDERGSGNVTWTDIDVEIVDEWDIGPPPTALFNQDDNMTFSLDYSTIPPYDYGSDSETIVEDWNDSFTTPLVD